MKKNFFQSSETQSSVVTPKDSAPEVPLNKYIRLIHDLVDRSKYVHVDVYSVLSAFDVRSHSIGHAVKKLLCPGIRGAKDYETDLREAIAAIQRELESL